MSQKGRQSPATWPRAECPQCGKVPRTASGARPQHVSAALQTRIPSVTSRQVWSALRHSVTALRFLGSCLKRAAVVFWPGNRHYLKRRTSDRGSNVDRLSRREMLPGRRRGGRVEPGRSPARYFEICREPQDRATGGGNRHPIADPQRSRCRADGGGRGVAPSRRVGLQRAGRRVARRGAPRGGIDRTAAHHRADRLWHDPSRGHAYRLPGRASPAEAGRFAR